MNELLKFKVEFNYTLARLRSGELYIATNEKELIGMEANKQEQIIKCIEELSERLAVLKLQYKQLTGKEMTEKEFKQGFKS